MQESDSLKTPGSLSIQTGGRLLTPNRNLLSQFYSFDDEKTENIQKPDTSIRSPSAGDKTKDIQAQLEINQSKLNSLAKRIDDCLSASKTNYATGQVIQPSESSISASFVEENKEAKAPEQAIQDFKPEEPSDEPFLSPNVSNGIMKSVRASMDTTTEEIVMSLGLPRKSLENLKKNNVQQKEKIGQTAVIAPKPVQSVPKGSPKVPVQKTTRSNTNEKTVGSLKTSDIQKKLDTVSSLIIETGEELPRLKEKYLSPKGEKRVNNYLSPPKAQQKEEGNLSARNRGEKVEGNLAVNKKPMPQARPTTNSSKPAASNPTVETEKPGIKARDTQTERKGINNKALEKTRSPPVRNEPKPLLASRQTPKNNAVAAVEKKNNLNEDKKIAASKAKPVRQSLTVKTGNIPKKESITIERPLTSTSRKSNGIMRFPEECIVGDLEAIRMISPVSPDTKSAKGIYDISTPGYNFDTPHHNNPNNLSINDSKNLSFDSALFGKDLSVRMDNLQVRRKSGFNSEQNRPKETLKRNNSVKHEKVSTEEDLESSFTKAFTTRKNKIVNELSNFEERMESDLHYRRKFREDLQRFLDEQKSKLTEDQTERLIERLVDDSRRRKVQAYKIELQNEKGYRESGTGNTTPVMSEDQLNQTFERLVSDAKKRLLLQEEHEKVKALKQEELDKKIERKRSKSKMSREAEEKMVSKFTQEADRRRLQYEKAQRAKKDEEIRQANELLAQGFKPKSNNKAKSKVREYINSRTETSLDTNERRGDRSQQKSFQKEELSRSSSPVEILPTIKEKPMLNEKKFLTPKKPYLSIVSPANKAAEARESGISKASPKNNSFSSLEHLQSLRKNINKHKHEIEEHIQNLKEIDTDSQIKGNPTSPERTPQQHSRRYELEQTSMLKKEKNTSVKVPNKYKHVESKVAKHIIEGRSASIQQSQLTLSPDGKDKEMRELPKTALASPKAQNTIRESLKEERSPVKQNKNDKEDNKGKGQSQTKYMSDKAAINFVEKLINEFKLAKKM